MSDFDDWELEEFKNSEDAEFPKFNVSKKGKRTIPYGWQSQGYEQELGGRNPGGSVVIAWCWDDDGWSHGLVWITPQGKVRWDGGEKSSYMGTNSVFKETYGGPDTNISNLTEVLGLFGEWCGDHEYNIEVAGNIEEVIAAGFPKMSRVSEKDAEIARLKEEVEKLKKRKK